MFAITKAAATAIRNQLRAIGEDVYVPAILWAEDKSSGHGAWEVGYHRRSEVPSDLIVLTDGIEMVVEFHWRQQLQDKTLDMVDGYFKVA